LCVYIFIYMLAHGDPEASYWIRGGFGIATEQRGLFKIARIREGMNILWPSVWYLIIVHSQLFSSYSVRARSYGD
jgi:hypothetical protein